jgi:hypothetical protein
VTTARLDDTRHDVVASLALRAEAECFKLANQFEGERIVKLTDVDI